MTMTTPEMPGLIAKLLWEGVRLGPVVQLRMFFAAAPWLFSASKASISKAGAAGTIVAVDAQRQATVAAIAFTLAKLGAPGLVASITHAIVTAKRPDAVVQISLEGIAAGYIGEVMAVNTQLLHQGRVDDAVHIAQALAARGHDDFLKLLTEGPLKNVTKPIKDAANWVMDNSSVGSGDLNFHSGDLGDEEEEEAEKEKETAHEGEQEASYDEQSGAEAAGFRVGNFRFSVSGHDDEGHTSAAIS